MFVKTPFQFNNNDLRRYFERPGAFDCWIYAKHDCYFYVYFDIRTFNAFIVDFDIEKQCNVNKVLKNLFKEIKKLQFDFLYSVHDLGNLSFKKLDEPNIQFHFGNKYTYSFLLA